MRGVQKCTYAGASLRSKNYATLHCIILDTATDPKNNNGDNFVDFGITEMFIDGEDEIVLEFNPQGNILDLIK